MADPERDPLMTLLALSGAREQPSPDATAAARAAALSAWSEGIAQPAVIASRRWKAWWPAAAAAVVALAVLVTVMVQPTDRDAFPVAAVVEVVQGHVELAPLQGAARAAASGSRIDAGTQLNTLEGRVALRLANQLSLRLDRDTRVRFDGDAAVTLLEGGLYVDSGSAIPGGPLRVMMPLGSLEHVGTQYQVTSRPGLGQVRVREGTVRMRLAAPSGRPVELIQAGEGIRIDSAGAIERYPIRTHGADWDWVSDVAPTFAIEGRSLHEFLVWICREHGWTLQWSSSDAEVAARRAVLHGSIAGLRTEQALAVVSAITRASLSVQSGVLAVDLPEPTPGQQ